LPALALDALCRGIELRAIVADRSDQVARLFLAQPVLGCEILDLIGSLPETRERSGSPRFVLSSDMVRS
jgi:hypothetical protein